MGCAFQSQRWMQTGRRRLGLVLCCCLAISFAGCVQRRLTIRSNPPGALVYIDNYEIGRTPVATDYVYYGTRSIRLVKDGFETRTVEQFIPPPWYEVFPLEFVSENLVPLEIRDERMFSYDLLPQVIVPRDQLLSRAQALRDGSRRDPRLLPGSVPPNDRGTIVIPPQEESLPRGIPSVPLPSPPPTRGG